MRVAENELSDSADISSFLPGKLWALRGRVFPGDSGSAPWLRGGMHRATVTLQGSSAGLHSLFQPQEEWAALNRRAEKKHLTNCEGKFNKTFLFLSSCGFDFAELQAEGGFPLMDPSISPSPCPLLMMYDVFSVTPPSCLSEVPSSRGP